MQTRNLKTQVSKLEIILYLTQSNLKMNINNCQLKMNLQLKWIITTIKENMLFIWRSGCVSLRWPFADFNRLFCIHTAITQVKRNYKHVFFIVVVDLKYEKIVGGCTVPHSRATTPDFSQVQIFQQACQQLVKLEFKKVVNLLVLSFLLQTICIEIFGNHV